MSDAGPADRQESGCGVATKPRRHYVPSVAAGYRHCRSPGQNPRAQTIWKEQVHGDGRKRGCCVCCLLDVGHILHLSNQPGDQHGRTHGQMGRWREEKHPRPGLSILAYSHDYKCITALIIKCHVVILFRQQLRKFYLTGIGRAKSDCDTDFRLTSKNAGSLAM